MDHIIVSGCFMLYIAMAPGCHSHRDTMTLGSHPLDNLSLRLWATLVLVGLVGALCYILQWPLDVIHVGIQ